MAKLEPVADVATEPQAPQLPAAVAQLIDAHWPVQGDPWQQQQATAGREAFKIELTTILKES